MTLPLEEFWAEMLSRVPARITAAWHSLNKDEQTAIKAHLTRMCQEDGWLQSQRDSAEAALQVINTLE